MKSFFIADAPRFENETVTTYFCLASLSVREKKGGGQYLALMLADKTGQLEARMWEEFADVLGSCREGCFVKAQGQISRYQGKFQITLTRMRSAEENEVEPADFVPASRFDVNDMEAELRGYVGAFRNPWLRELVLRLLDDPEIGPAFRMAPAAKKLHHAWLGGLLEHVLHLVRVCRSVLPFYPEVDPDLVVTGAILHDLGKVRELSWRTSFDYTLEGQLIGHISIAQRMLSEHIAAWNAEIRLAQGNDAEVFPGPLRLLLEHMLLSHHGRLEFGSPRLPMTPEALLLSALDDLEAKFQNLRGEFAAAVAAGRGPEQPTEGVRSMDRNLFDSARFLEQRPYAAPVSGPPGTAGPEPPGISVPEPPGISVPEPPATVVEPVQQGLLEEETPTFLLRWQD